MDFNTFATSKNGTVISRRAMQDTPRVFGRAGMSANWRVKGDNNVLSSDSGVTSPMNRPRWTHSTKSETNNDRQAASNEIRQSTGSTTADERATQAIQDGRRLYVGNLPYMAKTDDIAMLFPGDDYTVEHISMSLDPFTGRNPSYCFVDLQTKQQADAAIHELNGREVLGRPVKIGPGVAKSDRLSHRQKNRNGDSYDRWERDDAAEHWRGVGEQGRRVWVGGLPRMSNHYDVEKGVRELFHNYTIECVSKVIVPPTRDRAKAQKRGWDDRFLFVDFATAEEAGHAVSTMNGVLSWGVKIRVAKNRGGNSWKVDERRDFAEQPEDHPPRVSKEYILSHASFDYEQGQS